MAGRSLDCNCAGGKVLVTFRDDNSGSFKTLEYNCAKYENKKVWKQESMKTWKYENMKVWKHENMKVWKHENMKTWKYENMKTWKQLLSWMFKRDL